MIKSPQNGHILLKNEKQGSQRLKTPAGTWFFLLKQNGEKLFCRVSQAGG